MLRTAVVLLVAAMSTGCLRSTTVISIRPDGSGTVVQETGMSPQALAMLQGLAGGDNQKNLSGEMFGEQQAKKIATSMGARFVSGEPIKTAEMEGYRARFTFDDVRTLKMKMDSGTSASLGGEKEGVDPPFGFGFERRGSSSILTITLPDEKPGLPSMMPGTERADGKMSAEQNAQAMQMMKALMQGMFVDVSLEIDGRILKTNAPHVDGSRLTLLQIDFDKLVADETALQKFQDASDLKGLSNINGLKLPTEPKVTVEFTK